MEMLDVCQRSVGIKRLLLHNFDLRSGLEFDCKKESFVWSKCNCSQTSVHLKISCNLLIKLLSVCFHARFHFKTRLNFL